MPRNPLSIDFPHSLPTSWINRLPAAAFLGFGSLVLLAGCQSSGGLAQMFPKPAKPTQTIQSLVEKQKKAGLPKASQSKTDSAALAKSLDAGQAALGKYYQETSPAVQQSHLTEANRNYQEALKVEAGNPEAHHGLAIVCDLKGDFDSAELHYRAALEKDPKNSAILGDLGYSCFMQGKLTEAETILRQATMEDPGNAQAVKNLACVYGKQGQYNLAEATFRRVLDNGEVQQEMARLFPQGRPEVAANDRKFPWPGSNSTGHTTDALKSRLEEAQRNSVAEMQGRRSVLDEHTARQPTIEELKAQIAQLEAERDNAHRHLDAQAASNTPLVIADAPSGYASSQGGFPTGIQIQPQPRSESAVAAQPDGMITATSPNYSPRRVQNSLYPNGAPGQNPNSIQQTGGQQSPYGPNGQRPIEQALHETDRQVDPRTGLPVRDNIQQTQGQSGGLRVPNSYGQGDPASQPGPGFGAAPTTEAVDRFEAAKRRAAMVGMGGPEMMFPVVESTQRIAPGTGSTFNGGQYPAPERYLPTDAAPHDLNALINAPSGQFTAQPNDMGQLNAPTGQTFQNPNFQQRLQPQIPVASPLTQQAVYQDQATAAQSPYRDPQYRDVSVPNAGAGAVSPPAYDPRGEVNSNLYQYGTTQQYNPSQYNPSVNSQIETPSYGIPNEIQAPRGQDLMAPAWNQPSMTPRINPPPYPGRPAPNGDLTPEYRPAPPAETQPSASYYSEPAPIYSPGVQVPRDYRSRGTSVPNTYNSSFSDAGLGPRITPSR